MRSLEKALIKLRKRTRSFEMCIRDSDESDIVSMLGSFFESKGFRVLPASNGAEALKQVEKPVSYTHLDVYKRQIVHHALDGHAAEVFFVLRVCCCNL